MTRALRLVRGDAPAAPPAKASGSGFATLIVHADGFAAGSSAELCADVSVTLEREYCDGSTRLTIVNGHAISNEDEPVCAASVTIHTPNSLRALVAALLQLQADPHGAQILETITATPSKPDDVDEDDQV
jgi:hypothetical protein